ncbi:MAG: phage protease [Verrucomicrobiota bacterium]
MLISAAFANALPIDGVPKEIVYVPEGLSKITPFVDGKPQEIEVKVDASNGARVAAALQTDLDKRLADNVRPWVDFEHKGGASAGNPKSFRYEPGRGVILAMEWSKSGKEAIEGKDYSYFSPTFLLGDDGAPNGLPKRGPVGGMVNEPAFRDIPRIAAQDGEDSQTDTTETMSKLIFAALAISASAENAEADAVKAIEQLKSDKKTVDAKLAETEQERDDLKEKVKTIEAKQAEDRKERAKTLVEAAQADGRIAPKDEETAKDFREKIEAGDSFAEKMLSKLPKQHEGLEKPIIKAGSGGKVSDAHDFEKKAQGLVEAKQAPDIDTAFGMLADSDPEAYSGYLATLS